MTSNMRKGVLFGLGSPLLDISASTDDDFLTKYNLNSNDQILAEEKHLTMYHDMIKNYSVSYIAGGSALNTIRIAQWLLERQKTCVYLGCIGNDNFGRILQSKTEEAGVDARFQIHDTESTGTCAVILTRNGLNRSLCAYLAASKCYSALHLERKENVEAMEKANVFYIAGFFLTVCMDSVMKIAKHAASENKTFVMNLSAPYLSVMFKEQQEQVLPYIDIIFGNEMEAETFAKEHQINSTSIKTMALGINQWHKINHKRPRITIITQGKNPVIVAKGNTIFEFEVEQLKVEQIVDTNGAGDAFTGGFLAQLVMGGELDACVRCGIYASREIIQHSGCSFPKEHSFTLQTETNL